MSHHQQQRWRETTNCSRRTTVKEDEEEIKSRLQTATTLHQQRASRLVSSALRCEVTRTGQTESETESENSVAEGTSNIVLARVTGVHDGDEVDDRFISCRRTEIDCHLTEVKLHCCLVVMWRLTLLTVSSFVLCLVCYM